jgi:hypothetical protein
MIRLLVASSEVQVNHTEAFDSAVTSIDTRSLSILSLGKFPGY